MVRLYVPAIAVVALVMFGFCRADAKLFGPVHAYVAPATAAVVRLMVFPVHTGELDPGPGAAGVAFTTTATVPAEEVHPRIVTVTLYVPVAAVVALAIDGFCAEELKLFGPVQVYVAPATAGVDRLTVLPEHTGELLDAVGVAGPGFTTTATVPAADVQPFVVTVTLYVPLAAVVALTSEGFCTEALKLFGPVQLYVAPATAGVCRFSVLPEQIGELLDAVGVAGVVFTTTAVVPTPEVHPFAVTVTLYVPAIATVALMRDGFCTEETNDEGPVHEYVAPATAGVDRLIVLPVHTGVFDNAVGVAGVAFTTTAVVPAADVHPLVVTVTL
jgi:formaldehyde-activating enzyme involved in methanogenesis